MKQIACTLGLLGSLVLLILIIEHTKTINVFLVWDTHAYQYIVWCAIFVLGSFSCSLLVTHRSNSVVAVAGFTLFLIAFVCQTIFGQSISFWGVSALYAAGIAAWFDEPIRDWIDGREAQKKTNGEQLELRAGAQDRQDNE